MCGRYGLGIATEKLVKRFRVDEIVSDVNPNAEIFPSELVPTVSEIQGTRRLGTMKWGLVPGFITRGNKPKGIINARSETASQNNAFRSAFRSRRCIVPALGFFEWKSTPGQKRKQRIWFSPSSGEIVGFAGIWEPWLAETGETVSTVAILTCEPNSLVHQVHNRMPVMLLPENEDVWLSGHEDSELLNSILVPYPAEAMCSEPIDQKGNVEPILSLFDSVA